MADGTAYRGFECENGNIGDRAHSTKKTGVTFPRYFTARLAPGQTPYDEVRWETRTASIGNDKGAVIFEQRDIEVPADWSQTATNIVASKYFHGQTADARVRTELLQKAAFDASASKKQSTAPPRKPLPMPPHRPRRRRPPSI